MSELTTVVPVIEIHGASKQFGSGDRAVRALHDIDLTLHAGDVAVVSGPSGSGKSTLLHAIAGLEPLDAGTIAVDGHDVGAMSGSEAARFRRTRLGFVFQFFQLIPTLNAVQNVAMPLVLDGVASGVADARAEKMLDAVGLAGLGGRYGAELSGGQLQRVAVARALVGSPAVVLADEPTGSLDRANGVEITDLLHQEASRRGAALVIVTHDPTLARPGDLRFELIDGVLGAAEVVNG